MLASIFLGALLALVGYVAVGVLRAIFFPPKPVVVEYQPQQVGQITAEELSKNCGLDPRRPLLLAVRGRVFDVTLGSAFYGPGGPYCAFAGRECARALAKLAVSEEECSDKLDDLSQRELETLKDWEEKFEDKYAVVGQLVAPKQLTLEQLGQYTGRDGQPIYLAVRGTVFDVTTGRDYYGPDGVYPFGGRECARALARMSTDLADCTAEVEGLSAAELDTLRDWQSRFWSKYPIIGNVVAAAAPADKAPAGAKVET